METSFRGPHHSIAQVMRALCILSSVLSIQAFYEKTVNLFVLSSQGQFSVGAQEWHQDYRTVGEEGTGWQSPRTSDCSGVRFVSIVPARLKH